MKRPWNTVNTPVYSLATRQMDKFNMNICTYVTPVCMKPKIYCIALDYNTLSYEYADQEKHAVLQFLNLNQIGLVKPLGKKTAKKYDKLSYLDKKKHLKDWENFKVLKDSNALLLLEKINRTSLNSDHEIFYYKVIKSKTFYDKNGLNTQDLIKAKVIL